MFDKLPKIPKNLKGQAHQSCKNHLGKNWKGSKLLLPANIEALHRQEMKARAALGTACQGIEDFPQHKPRGHQERVEDLFI